MLPADRMVSARDGVLDVAQQGVDPVELGVLHAGTPTSGDVAVVDIGGGIEGPKTAQAVANDPTAWRNGLLGVATHLGKRKAAHTAQLNPLWVAVLIGLHGGDEGELVLSAAPALARPLTAQVGVIDLDAPGEPLTLVALVHDLQQLVLELPGGVVADAELSGQL